MQKLFTLFLAFAVSLGNVLAHDAKIGNVYYNFNSSNKTAIVTYAGSGPNSYDNEYSGAITIPASVNYNGERYAVTTIGENAFLSCANLTSVSLPESIISIETAGFEDCTSLSSVTLPNSLKTIGDEAFLACSKLTAITIPNSVTSIGKNSFGSSGLVSVEIPNSITTISENAFFNCKSLTSVTIPNSVLSIGASAFMYCESLQTLSIPNSVTVIDNSAFRFCNGLTSVIIPNSVITIGKDAFSSCSNLAVVEIPKSVATINDYAFAACTSLTAFLVDSENQNYCDIDGVLFSSDKTKLVLFPISKSTSYTIPSSVTSFGEGAFYNNTNLISLTCKALTPPTCGKNVFYRVDKSIPIYVPAVCISDYLEADGWNAFTNIQAIPEKNSLITYIDNEASVISSEDVTLHMPISPDVSGFTFFKWVVVSGDLEDGIFIQATYKADDPSSAPEIVTNPENPAQKLIRNGNVYILTEDKTYTIDGRSVR